MPDFAAWRSPPPQQTPLVEPGSLPTVSPLRAPQSPLPSAASQQQSLSGKDVLHPSFLPPCEHGSNDGDMHAHAFDLLSLSAPSPGPTHAALPKAQPTAIIPASVPSNTSVLSATRPTPGAASSGAANGLGAGSAPKARRMSSSTTGVLGRGKLGATGEGSLGLGGINKDSRPSLTSHATSYTSTAPIASRRPGPTGTSPTPQLFDFAKTDRRPSAGRSITALPSMTVPASLPNRSHMHAAARNIRANPSDDMELDTAFDGEDEDEEDEGDSGRSGSAELEMDMDEDGEVDSEWKKLALGTGSGGVKGRRAGMVFKCVNCAKEYRHPSCLIKHRWEHSPHWKEPTQLSMSKHQQVQMLEAAAILAHLDPTQGRALPNDKSLWPAVLSPPQNEPVKLRRPSSAARDNLRSPSISNAPLTPSSLRESSTLGSMGKPRKPSPDSDSTTSSLGDGYPAQPRSLSGQNGNGITGHSRPVGIDAARSSSFSSAPGPGTPQSVGSLPNELAGLHFQPGTPTSFGMSPIPNRNGPMSLKSRQGLVGGGMFGNSINFAVPSSSVRSGAMADDEEEEELRGTNRRGKSSSEEAEERRKGREGEEWGMAMEMEL